MSTSLKPSDIKKLTVWNDTKRDYPNLTLVQLIEQQLDATPHAVAVIFEEQSLTFFELHQMANQWARYLQEIGVTRNSLVVVHLSRSLELVVLLVAILKAGGAYLPIDIKQPPERVKLMIADSKAQYCVTDSLHLKKLSSLFREGKLFTIDSINQLASSYPIASLKNINSPNDLSYVIYTSGSTGAPKGVANIQAGTVNRLAWMQEQFQLTIQDRVLQKTSLSFDVAVWEFWWPLISGARLILASLSSELDSELLIKDIISNSISVMHFVPSQLQAILATEKILCCKSLRLVISSGEALPSSTWNVFHSQSNAELYNLYGPTEASIDVCFYRCQKKNIASATIPIGKPIANTQLFVMDNNYNLVKPGEIGELYIAGMGLAQGYWKNPELTASKFIDITPFPDCTVRAYKSGDLAKWLDDGNLEFVGRIDEQIKIRGFRVEPTEIEEILLKHPFVKQAAVVLKLIPSGQKALIGYLIKNKTEDFTTKKKSVHDELYSLLRTHLPDYMIPSKLIWIEQLPLSLSGKLDKNSLPEPVWGSEAQADKNHYSPIEEKLIEIWRNFLNISSLSTNDNFFALGGDSLLAMLIANAAGKEGLYFNAQSLMTHPTIYALAEYLRQSKDRESQGVKTKKIIDSTIKHPIYQAKVAKILKEENIDLTEVEGIYPATPMQQGMVFHTLHNMGVGMYLDQISIEIEGHIKEQAFIRAWETLILRHDALRTGFFLTEFDFPQQVVYTSCPLSFFSQDISHLSSSEQEQSITDYMLEIRYKGFNVKKPPLFDIALFQMGGNKNFLIYTDYHSISDALTQGILFNEFLILYKSYLNNEQFTFSPAPSFIDYVEWLEIQDKHRAKHYWQQLLQPVKSPTIIDIDKQPPILCYTSKEYCNHTIHFKRSEVETFKRFAKDEQVTLNTVIQATWAILLARYSSEQTIVYALLESGRQIDLDNVAEYVGAFSIALPVLYQNNTAFTIRELLKSLQGQVIESSQFSYYPLSDIQQLSPLSHHTPLLRYAITFPNYTVEQLLEKPLDIKGLSIKKLSRFTKSHYPLTVSVMPYNDQLIFDIAYDPAYFSEESIRDFSQHWQSLLKNIVNQPENIAAVLPILTAKEEFTLLKTWNNTEQDYPKNETVVNLFEKKAAIFPEKIAIVFENKALTYRELHNQSNQWGHYLRKKGVRSQTPVVMLLPRNINAIVCLLAILKAGGCYVPLDPNFPSLRLQELLSVIQSPILISTRQIISEKQLENLSFETSLILLDECYDEIHTSSKKSLKIKRKPSHLAYILYTSGSTGKPKGVAQTHQTLTNLFFWQEKRFPYNSNKHILQFANLVFDVSLQEITYALCGGGKLYLSSQKMKDSVTALLDYIEKQAIEMVFLPTTLLALIAEAGLAHPYLLSSVQHIIVAGEALQISSIVRSFFIKYPHIQLINQYGPTETHVVSQYILPQRVDQWAVYPSIGMPINNVKFYVLDQFMQLTAPGIAGELYIAGDNLAQGYWRNEEETQQRFLDLVLGSQQPMRIYRTGDKVRWEKEGYLTYLGRYDEQLKIRGYRIEPAEIESMVLTIPEVRQCRVIAQKSLNKVSQLNCYITLKDQKKYTANQIKYYLKELLPAYMIPENVIIMDHLPLTSNRKLDRNGLPTSLLQPLEVETKPKWRDDDEIQLHTICSDVFGTPTLSPTQEFFEVGANSISLLRLSLKLEKHFCMKMSLRDILNCPSVQRLHHFIQKKRMETELLDVIV